MSLILDALNRSRSEQGEVPNIQTVHASDGGAGAPDRRAWGLGAALIVALAVIAWLLLSRTGDESVPLADRAPSMAVPDEKPVVPEPAPRTVKVEAVKPVAEAKATEPVEAPSKAVKPPSTVVEKPQAQSSAAVSALYEGATAEKITAPPPAVEANSDIVAKPVEPKKREPAAAEKNVARGEPAPEEEAVDLEQIIQQAESELEDARLAEHPSPFINSLSQQTKDSIPTLIYERHDYSGTPGKSRVVLNGATLAAGGNSRGVKVEEILPDSVVLNYQGTSFRLRALNSWVNL